MTTNLINPNQANAGFEWTPPDQQQAPVMPAPQPAPVVQQPVAPAPVAPQPAPVMQQPITPAPQPAPVAQQPVTPAPAPEQQPAPMPAPVEQNKDEIKWENTANYAVIEGFGSDIPLPIALSDIVPPNYAYSFGPGVNPAVTVSWEGGKPWNVVLASALAPHYIAVKIVENKVILTSKLYHEKEKEAEVAAPAETAPVEPAPEMAPVAQEEATAQPMEEQVVMTPDAPISESPSPSEISEQKSKEIKEVEIIYDPALEAPASDDVPVLDESVPVLDENNEAAPVMDNASTKRGAIVDPGNIPE